MSTSAIEALPPESLTAQNTETTSYRQILRSSAWIGGSTLLNIAIGIVRTKMMAVLLGPAGFGMNGLYSSVADMAQSVAGMGVNSSGVRQIAEAAGTGDGDRIAQTAAVLRRTSRMLGVGGAVLLALLSRPISILTFGTPRHAVAICLLSLVVLFKLISNGQSALIQGLRRVADLAKMNVWGALCSLVVSVPLVYVFGQRGIVPALVCVAGVTCLTSWWYSRKVELPFRVVTPTEVRQEAGALLRLGSAFMVSSFLTLGVTYAVRVLLLRVAGAEATGQYQAAWTLGGLYVGIILQAMGADFYPRLAAQANDNTAVNRLVNEQTEVGVLIGGPGVVATIIFGSAVLALFYSARFEAAVGVLRWISLGTLMQVVSWPMGFIVLAKGQQKLFLCSDMCWSGLYLLLAWICVKRFGLEGAGIAFFASYVCHAALNYVIARHVSMFSFDAKSRKVGLLSICASVAAIALSSMLPLRAALLTGGVLLLAVSFYSLRQLLTVVPDHRASRMLARFIA